MKINIYGVGRSGTKALQLYCVYYLAKHYGKTRLNYEPFLFRTRKHGDLTQEGMALHNSTPNFMGPEDAPSPQFTKYMRSLAEGEAVVTKFIRGNGRINAINQAMQPDISVVVVRNLYQVLASIAVEDWGLERNWPKFLGEIKIKFPKLKPYLSSHNKLIRHALLWYTLNKSVLENAKDSFFIDYDNLGSIQDLLEKRGIKAELPISHEKFKGGNIHGNPYPLKDLDYIPAPAQSPAASSPALKKENQFPFLPLASKIAAYFKGSKQAKSNPSLPKLNVGSFCVPCEDKPKEPYYWDLVAKPRATIQPFPLFDEMQAEIGALLEAKIKNNP